MIHYVSKFNPLWHTERHIADALEWHGQPVQCYDVTVKGDRPHVKPGDLVFTSTPTSIDLEQFMRWKDEGARLACWYFDWIWDYQKRHERYLPALRLMDAVFSTDGFDSSRYEAEGVKCREWLPQAAPQEERLIDVPAGVPTHDVLFLGHLYNHDRKELINRLRAARLNVGVYGVQHNGRRIWGRERQGLIRSAKIVIGVNCRDDIPGYWSNRVYLTLASGGFFLCRKVEGLDRLFQPGKHYAQFTGSPVKAVNRWLKRNKERERIRQAGHKYCMAQHTYIHRVGELIDRLRARKLLK